MPFALFARRTLLVYERLSSSEAAWLGHGFRHLWPFNHSEPFCIGSKQDPHTRLVGAFLQRRVCGAAEQQQLLLLLLQRAAAAAEEEERRRVAASAAAGPPPPQQPARTSCCGDGLAAAATS